MPLFKKIEQGEIIPPYYYEFGSALGKESEFSNLSKPFLHAEAEFMAALEDWESQDWFKKLKNK